MMAEILQSPTAGHEPEARLRMNGSEVPTYTIIQADGLYPVRLTSRPPSLPFSSVVLGRCCRTRSLH